LSNIPPRTISIDLIKALLLNYPTITQKQAQNNTVIVQQEEMDWVVGLFEPTTSL
jgi:hypothetical protein